MPADLVLIAIGFSTPSAAARSTSLGLELDSRGNVARAAVPDLRGRACSPPATPASAQSLIVTAIAEGRRCARIVDRYLR